MKIKFIYLLIPVLLLGACVTDREKPEEFTVNIRSPQIPIGEVELQFDRLFSIGNLRKSTVAVSYFPEEDAVCLNYKSDFISYFQFWSRSGRAAFINALATYNREYDERTINRSQRRSMQTYGIIQGFLFWRLHTYSVQARANMNVELGYNFRDRAPYFTVNQKEAEFIHPRSRDENRSSPVITMYFTRAQAAELAALFDQVFLQELENPNAGRVINSSDIDWDEY